MATIFNNELIPVYESNYTIDQNGTLTCEGRRSVVDIITTFRGFTTRQESISGKTYQVYYVNETTKRNLVGSSICLEDLVYEPNADGHRLFMNSTNYKPMLGLVSKIFTKTKVGIQYRDKSGGSNQDHNSLFFYNGPCYKFNYVSG